MGNYFYIKMNVNMSGRRPYTKNRTNETFLVSAELDNFDCKVGEFIGTERELYFGVQKICKHTSKHGININASYWFINPV